MITVAESLARLEDVVASGELAQTCRRVGVEIVILFGSAVSSDDPGDIDLAVGFEENGARDFLAAVNALGVLVPGDHLDVMNLDRADPVAQKAATTGHRVLYETAPAVSAEREIKAFMMYEDTRWLRRLQQEALLSGPLR